MNFFLKKKFDPTKCKTLLQLTIQRIKILRNKDTISISKLRMEIAKLLQSGQDSNAAVENLFRQTNIVAAYNLIEQFCEVIVRHLVAIKSQKDFPAHSKEAIASLIYAADGCNELQELQKLKKIFVSKYGSEFYMAVQDRQPDSGVNMQIIEKLTTQPPTHEIKMKLMKEIADQHDIKWSYEQPAVNIPKSETELINGSFNHPASATQTSEPGKADGKKPAAVTNPMTNHVNLGDEAKASFEQDIMPSVSTSRKKTLDSTQERKIQEYKFEDVEAAAEFTFLCASQAAEAAKVTVNMIKRNSRKKKTDASSSEEGVQQPDANRGAILDEGKSEVVYSVHPQVTAYPMGEVVVKGYETEKSRTLKINSSQDEKDQFVAYSDAHEDVRGMPYFDKHEVVRDMPHFDKYQDLSEIPLFDEHASKVFHFDKHEDLLEMTYFGKHEDVSGIPRFDNDDDISKTLQFEKHDAISEKSYIDKHEDASEVQQSDVCVSDNYGTVAYFSTQRKVGEYAKSFKKLEDRGIHVKCANSHSEESQKASYYHHKLNVDEDKYSGQYDETEEQVDFLSERSPLSYESASFKMGGTRYRKSMTHKKLEWHSKHAFDSPGSDDSYSIFEPSNSESTKLFTVSEEEISPSSDLSIETRKLNWQIKSTTSEGSDAMSPSRTFNGRSVRSTKSKQQHDISSPIAINFNPLVGR